MRRAQRLELVQRVVDDLERRRAEALADCERQLAASEARLLELQAYQARYARDFAARAGTGMNGAGLRDYQTFLARLEEAVRQQSQIVMRARAQRDAERRNWQSAAQRAEAVGQMVKRWRMEEQRLADRREQHEADERAQRAWAREVQLRGA